MSGGSSAWDAAAIQEKNKVRSCSYYMLVGDNKLGRLFVPFVLPLLFVFIQECSTAIAQLQGKEPTSEFLPDTFGGCMCRNVADCGTNEKREGQQWCNTNQDCSWSWDFCTQGRRSGSGLATTTPSSSQSSQSTQSSQSSRSPGSSSGPNPVQGRGQRPSQNPSQRPNAG